MTLGLAAGWIIIYKEIAALFARDDEVRVVYSDEDKAVRVYVDNAVKAEALEILLKHEYEFGNIKLSVDVIPANEGEAAAVLAQAKRLRTETDFAVLVKCAFQGNQVFAGVRSLPAAILGGWTYILFGTLPAQIYTDDLSCWQGYKTMLYEDIARDVIEPRAGVSCCTVLMNER